MTRGRCRKHRPDCAGGGGPRRTLAGHPQQPCPARPVAGHRRIGRCARRPRRPRVGPAAYPTFSALRSASSLARTYCLDSLTAPTRFPPSAFQWIQRIKRLDIPIWWFDGDHAAARASFIRRGTEQVASFDRYIAELRQHWTQIEPLIKDSTIRVINADGSRLPPEAIFSLMFGDDRGDA